MVAIGQSTTQMLFDKFRSIARSGSEVSRNVVLVNAAVPGKLSQNWVREGRLWTNMLTQVSLARLSRYQVQVIWIKLAHSSPSKYGEFPAHVLAYEADLKVILCRSKKYFPNLRLAYLTPRYYSGYRDARLSICPEPYAYEGGYAVRWIITRQAAGDDSLNADPLRGAVKVPVLLWGPYLWTEAANPRNFDGFAWQRSDFAADGIHPSPAGSAKGARFMLDFFKSDPYARRWFTVKR